MKVGKKSIPDKNPPCKGPEVPQLSKPRKGSTAWLKSGMDKARVQVKMTEEARKSHLLFILREPYKSKRCHFLFLPQFFRAF